MVLLLPHYRQSHNRAAVLPVLLPSNLQNEAWRRQRGQMGQKLRLCWIDSFQCGIDSIHLRYPSRRSVVSLEVWAGNLNDYHWIPMLGCPDLLRDFHASQGAANSHARRWSLIVASDIPADLSF